MQLNRSCIVVFSVLCCLPQSCHTFSVYFSDSGLGIGGGGGNRDEPDRVYVVEMGNSVSSTSSTSFRSVASVVDFGAQKNINISSSHDE